jgi:hypothetical protein
MHADQVETDAALGRRRGLGPRRSAARQPAGRRRQAVGGHRLRGPGGRRPRGDLQPAWNLFADGTRHAFLAELEVDAAMRLRGRGWALSQALIALPYWATNPGIVAQALRRLALVLTDEEG